MEPEFHLISLLFYPALLLEHVSIERAGAVHALPSRQAPGEWIAAGDVAGSCMLSRDPLSGSGGRLGFQWALGGGPSNSFSSAVRRSETGCSNVLYATWSSCPIASSHGTWARMSSRSWLGGNSPSVTRAARSKHITRSFLVE